MGYKFKVKAVSFVHVFSQLGIEFGTFQGNERGGLLIADYFGDNTVKYLVFSSPSRYNEGHNQTVDNNFLEKMMQLRQINFLRKEDIQVYRLVLQLWKEIFTNKLISIFDPMESNTTIINL